MIPVLLHGWLGGFLEFLPILDLLRSSYTPQCCHIISSFRPYQDTRSPHLFRPIVIFLIEDIARVFGKFVVKLGFGAGYVVQGGDVGSEVGWVMAAEHKSCKAIHSEHLLSSLFYVSIDSSQLISASCLNPPTPT